MTRPGRFSEALSSTRCGSCLTTVTDSEGPTVVLDRYPLRPSLSFVSINAVWRRVEDRPAGFAPDRIVHVDECPDALGASVGVGGGRADLGGVHDPGAGRRPGCGEAASHGEKIPRLLAIAGLPIVKDILVGVNQLGLCQKGGEPAIPA